MVAQLRQLARCLGILVRYATSCLLCETTVLCFLVIFRIEHLRVADNLRKNKRVMSEFRGYPNDPGCLLDLD